MLALLCLLNILSPKKIFPILTPYKPPTSSPFFQTSALCAKPSLCKTVYAFFTSLVIHVPACPFLLIVLQLPITWAKALSVVKLNASWFSNFFMLLLTFISPGNKIKRGSGHHHKICLPSYQGKIPLL